MRAATIFRGVTAAKSMKRRALRLLSAVVTLGLLCAIADRVEASESSPRESTEPSSYPAARSVVESFHTVLLDCMKRSAELGFSGRYQRIEESEGETFDIPTIARASIFRGWKRLSTEDRTRWVALAREYWASSYAHEYRSFSGQSFETLGVEPAEDESVMVHTKLTHSSGDDVELDYHLQQVDGGWRIVDFHIAGRRSEARRLREFNYSVLERRSFEALLTEIEQKIEQFQRELGSAP